ncbi:hypothetical protein [Paenibacillus sp. GYB003]|uniref:hypothetical protein n=1 Tax=Paenibacillus sp. GYB003 TaxID=2994392 RepID=UPI002F96AE1C
MSNPRTDIKQLLRNIMILPVVRSNFERDKQHFLTENSMTPYASTAERALQRINEDVRNLHSVLQAAGVKLINEKQGSSNITVFFDYHSRHYSYNLQWGTFDGEIELLQHYYLGNLNSSTYPSQGDVQ